MTTNSTMGIYDDYPQDPTKPDYNNFAADGIEVTIPWNNRPIELGTGLKVATKGTKAPNLSNAFRRSGDGTPAVFHFDSLANYREASTSHAAAKSEHMHLAIHITAGICGGLVEATGQFAYDRSVDSDSNVSMTSSRVRRQFSYTARLKSSPFIQAIDLARSHSSTNHPCPMMHSTLLLGEEIVLSSTNSWRHMEITMSVP